MELVETLTRRANFQKRVAEIKERVARAAQDEEDEEPEQAPEELIEEVGLPAQAKMYRQGDVLIVAAQSPSDFFSRVDRENGRLVLAHGESGHTHAIETDGVELWQSPYGDDPLLHIPEEGGLVTHEEHGAIDLPGGWFRVVRQQEYMARGQSSYVAD